MTVGELIERLKNYHAATPVLVQGYEHGYDEIGFRYPVRATRVENADWWHGSYDDDENSGTEVLILQRIKITAGGNP